MKMAKKILSVFIGFTLLGLGGVSYTYIVKEKQRKEQENLVWLARCELVLRHLKFSIFNIKKRGLAMIALLVYELDLFPVTYGNIGIKISKKVGT